MEIAGKQVPEEMQVRLAKLVEMVKRGTPNCRAHPTKRKGPSGDDIMDIHNLSQSISKKSFHKQLNG